MGCSHHGHHLTYIVITISILCSVQAASVPAAGVTSQWDCSLDDDVTNPQLAQCLQRGQKFVGRYIRHLQPDENEVVRRPFDKCSSFILLHDCLQPLLDNCVALREHVLAEWGPILDVLRCACSGGTECIEHLQCFEEEFGGTLVRNCDRHFKLDIQQHTRSRCHFLGEAMHCKRRLITSGCGHHMGQFAFMMTRQAQRHILAKEDCYVSRHDHYAGGLVYTQKCSRYVPYSIQQCRDDYLSPETVLVFREEENDLVAVNGRKTVQRACQDYNSYQSCTKQYRDGCPTLVNQLLSFDEEHRTYLMKMQVICSQEDNVYGTHVRCYREASRKNRLQTCDLLWPKLNRTTPYKFYCLPDNHHTTKMKRELDTIRSCYKSEFTSICGEEAAAVMDTLIQKAFQDPSYLLLGYQPRCWAHNPPYHPPPEGGNSTLLASPVTTRRQRTRERAATQFPVIDNPQGDEWESETARTYATELNHNVPRKSSSGSVLHSTLAMHRLIPWACWILLIHRS